MTRGGIELSCLMCGTCDGVRAPDGTGFGRGLLRVKHGIRYEGGWHMSKRCGEGVQEWPNGERYHGGWKDDSPDGQGIWLRRSGRFVLGVVWDGRIMENFISSGR